MTDGRFAQLPEPIALEDTVTSEDVVVVHETDQGQNEIRWLLKNAAG